MSLFLLVRLKDVQKLFVCIRVVRETRFDLVQIRNGMVELAGRLLFNGVLVCVEAVEKRRSGVCLCVVKARREHRIVLLWVSQWRVRARGGAGNGIWWVY
jgi:hypothetical protein